MRPSCERFCGCCGEFFGSAEGLITTIGGTCNQTRIQQFAMDLPNLESVTCGNCDHVFTHTGAPMERCPSCGYCSYNVAEFDKRLRPVIESAAYRSQLADARYPENASRHICAGVLAEAGRAACRRRLDLPLGRLGSGRRRKRRTCPRMARQSSRYVRCSARRGTVIWRAAGAIRRAPGRIRDHRDRLLAARRSLG
jgi:hypothetical protein